MGTDQLYMRHYMRQWREKKAAAEGRVINHNMGRPRNDLERENLIARNFYLPQYQIDWLRDHYGAKRMSAGIRAMIDDQMAKATAAKTVILPPMPKRQEIESSIPWPTKAQLMRRRA